MTVFKRLYLDLPADLIDKAKEQAEQAGMALKHWVENLMLQALTSKQKSNKTSKKKGA